MNSSVEVVQPIPCSICLLFKHSDLINQCSDCHDWICGGCPAFACSCVSPGPIGQLRKELRTAALELKEFHAISFLMGPAMLSRLQRARLALLASVVPSLTAEINRLNEEEHGEIYDA